MPSHLTAATQGREQEAARSNSRRKFLGYAGATMGLFAIASACNKNKNNDGVDLGSGDTGILNYAYALEQLEAAFYKRITDSPYSGMSTLEAQYFAEIRDHEIAHREFFKTALGGSRIPDLEVDFSSVNFGSRDSVSAYNGAGKLLTDANNLLIAGKIVSVEARHAALIRDLISNGTFANNEVVDTNGLDVSRMPMEVLTIADPYIVTKINASNLPTS
jgi:hypothetical protein